MDVYVLYCIMLVLYRILLQCSVYYFRISYGNRLQSFSVIDTQHKTYIVNNTSLIITCAIIRILFHHQTVVILHDCRNIIFLIHYNDIIMNTMVSQIPTLTTVYSTVYSGTDQRKYQSSTSLTLVRGIHRWSVNSPHKGPVTRIMFPFNDIITLRIYYSLCTTEIHVCTIPAYSRDSKEFLWK